MNNQTHNELVRLADHEPLVLVVSALSDFLWDDFVRDTSPRVNYLMDRYDIRQLSRFGKELFEHLYRGEDVTTLVSLEEAEQYFRAKQNGEDPAFPSGYKPENAFWTGLMNDIVNSPAWSFLEQQRGHSLSSAVSAISLHQVTTQSSSSTSSQRLSKSKSKRSKSMLKRLPTAERSLRKFVRSMSKLRKLATTPRLPSFVNKERLWHSS